MEHVAGDLDREEDSGEPHQQNAGLPRPDVEAERDARGRRVRGGTLEGDPILINDQFQDGGLALGDREGDEEREDSDTLEEYLGRAVVGEADETVTKERPRQERKHDDCDESREAVDKPTCDEVRRNRDEGSRNGCHDEHDLLGAAHDGTGDPDTDRHDVVPEGAELPGLIPDWEPGPHVERHPVRVVRHDVRRFTEVVPRVVPAEVHLAVLDEVPVRLKTGPEHERQCAEKNRDVVPPCEEVGGGPVRLRRWVVRVAHYVKTTAKTRIRLVIFCSYDHLLDDLRTDAEGAK